jgi:hypothetical protein
VVEFLAAGSGGAANFDPHFIGVRVEELAVVEIFFLLEPLGFARSFCVRLDFLPSLNPFATLHSARIFEKRNLRSHGSVKYIAGKTRRRGGIA